jgi:hypothetical protein
LLDSLADPPSMLGLEGKGLQDEEIERSLEEIGLRFGTRFFISARSLSARAPWRPALGLTALLVGHRV